MKRTAVTIVAAFLVAAIAYAAQTMNVQNKSVKVMSGPSALKAEVARLNEGDVVTVLETGKDWVRVSTPDDKQGWVRKEALTKDEVKLASGSDDASVAASTKEQALTMKGFREEVEQDFKSKNKDLDFSTVDRMGRLVISVDEIKRFLADGGLQAGEGGAK